MSPGVTILVIGTIDTKAAEMLFLRRCIEAQGARASIMDVGVLGAASFEATYPNTAVAEAAGSTLESIAQLGEESLALAKMAEGAASLALNLYRNDRVDGVLILGGTMGTDLALDVTAALPLGFPKLVISTVAFSHLIPPERIAPDLMMVLWAGGLYGLNSVCESVLSRAAGAVVGACRAAPPLKIRRPRVAISSLGKSCLSYMTRLTPALENRGYEPVVFHCTGMGGRAMEALIDQGHFVAVFDLALVEVNNHSRGSVASAGGDRLESAGRRAVPQVVAPGASDMIDVQSWRPLPPMYAERTYYAHNRLIGSVLATVEERRELARTIAAKLNGAKGPTALLLPRHGIHEFDRPGAPLRDAQAHAACLEELRRSVKLPVELHDLESHINDDSFADAVLAIFDRWVSEGKIPAGVHAEVRH